MHPDTGEHTAGSSQQGGEWFPSDSECPREACFKRNRGGELRRSLAERVTPSCLRRPRMQEAKDIPWCDLYGLPRRTLATLKVRTGTERQKRKKAEAAKAMAELRPIAWEKNRGPPTDRTEASTALPDGRHHDKVLCDDLPMEKTDRT